MSSHAPISEKSHQKGGRSFSIKRALAGSLVAVLIFGLGVSVGSGQLGDRFDKQQSVNSGLPEKLEFSEVQDIYNKLRQNYDGELSEEKLMDGIKQGLAGATGDPYTEYFNAQQAKEFDGEINGSFTGIGAELGKTADGNVEIIAPIAGFPAEKAGLKAKDLITEINSETAIGITVTEAVQKIRGEAGTTVKLKVVRDKQKELSLEIQRQQINIPSVKYEVKDNIGLLTISRYGPDTAQLTREAANAFKQQNVKGIVLDLRGNPGGLLTAAVSVSSLWLDKNQVVLTEKRDGKTIETLRALGNPTLKGIKTVVLINEGSASASEITAGALRDNNAATIIGTKSYGKGSVQQLINLAGGTVLKVTSAHWFTPSGKGIDKAGIEPDQKIERSDEDFTAGRDPQLDAAKNFLK